MNDLTKLPPPPKDQTGITLDAFKHLPPPPQGQVGIHPNDISNLQQSTPSRSPYEVAMGIGETPQEKSNNLNRLGDTLNTIFPGKQVGQAIGTLGGLGLNYAKEKLGYAPQGSTSQFDSSAPDPTQVVGDVAQGALTVAAPNVGSGATALERIGANAALGVGLGTTNAIANGKNAGDTIKSGLEGGAAAGLVSGAGEGILALSKGLPQWLTKAAFPKLDAKNIQYGIDNAKVGGIQSIAKKSSQSMQNYESQIQGILSHPQYSAVAADSPSILEDSLSQFKNSNYTTKDLIDNAQNIAPKVGKLLQKMEAGQANIQELNTIRKELDAGTKSVYTSLNRPPESKMLGASLANSIRDYVQTTAPATKPIFGEYSKEVGLNKAIQAAVKKGETKVKLRDLVAGGAGFAHGGLKGALEAIILERGLSNPATQIGAAKLLQGGSKILAPVGTALLQGGKAPLIKKLTGNE